MLYAHLLNAVTLPALRAGKPVKTTFTYYRNNKAFSKTPTAWVLKLLESLIKDMP